jgi:exodeoxyribonuclease VII large subunit
MADRNLSFDFTAPPPEPPKVEKREPPEPRVLTVAELDAAIRGTLERSFAQSVLVEGEVANTSTPKSGHVYFCLKDEEKDAQIDAVIYKSSLTPRMRALLVDGARVRVRGRPTFWSPRGRLQLVADRVDAAGKGALLEALERLKAKLAAEGLFAVERKRALPAEPRVIGVVTSPSGAAIHDICRVAFRRGGARILLAPAIVQGATAPESIRRALLALQRVEDVDVIIVGRGGGSSEDLAAFNDEALVRTVAKCRVPVVSAVGHEVDVTLTDFAADRRAATPSQAAELLVPDQRERARRLAVARAHLARAMRAAITERRVALADVQSLLGDPRLAIASHQQTLDDLDARLEARAQGTIARRRELLARAQQRLAYVHPREVVARETAALARVSDRLGVVMRAALERRAGALGAAGARLDALSPLKVLSRGYAIATNEGRAVRTLDDVRPGDTVRVRVEDARFEASVTSVERVERRDA